MFNSKLKKNILTEIYFDNLRVEGKPAEEDLPEKNRKFRLIQVLLVILPLTLTSFTGQHFFSSTKVLPLQADALSTPDESENALLTPFTDPPKHLDFGIALADQWSDKMPSWSFSRSEKPNFNDYSLLLTRDDYMRLSTLFGLDIKTVVIDPGHGGKDPGAIGAKGTKEKEITLDVALKLKEKLKALDRFNVILTRAKDEFLTLAARVDLAKKNKADLFISIHVNSLPNQTVNLIETYYFGPPLNSETFRLAEAENKDSHYSVSEIEEIIQDIGNTLKRQESEILAESIQTSLYRHMSNQDPELIDSGVKMAPFVVISQIEVPSVLVEISCITNEEEEMKLRTSKYRDKIASYIDEGVVAYLDLNYFKIKTSNGEN